MDMDTDAADADEDIGAAEDVDADADTDTDVDAEDPMLSSILILRSNSAGSSVHPELAPAPVLVLVEENRSAIVRVTNLTCTRRLKHAYLSMEPQYGSHTFYSTNFYLHTIPITTR